MTVNLELVSLGDPLHFSHPTTWTPRWSRDLSVAALLRTPGWTSRTFDVWRGYEHRSAPVSAQGWKIHVSATVDNATRVLQVAGVYCSRQRLAFKHVRSLAMVAAANARSAPRSASGKFIAVYPDGEEQFLRTIRDLALLLEDEPGPYILSDRKWCEGAPVFFRYGAYVPMQTWTGDGRRVAARFDRSGDLVEDVRSVPFRLPIDIEVPAAVLERSGTFGAPPPMPVRITEAIQHSGCGGVYRGVLLEDGSPVVVKEARPHTGGSPDLGPAVLRLRHEAAVLGDLDGRACPRLRAVFVVDTHVFVASDEVAGTSLRHWVAAHHPMLHPGAGPAERDDYAARCAVVADSLARAVETLHAAGWAHNDIHPGNAIVRDDLTVALTDLEFASPLEHRGPPGMACAGFALATGTAAERDEFGVAMTRAFLLHPVAVGGLLELDPVVLERGAQDAARWFGAEKADPVAEAAARYGAQGRRSARVFERTGHRVGHAPEDITEDALVRYLHVVATPEHDHLVPADPAGSSTRLDALAVAHGAAGVVIALSTAGVPVPQEWSRYLERGVDQTPPTVASPGLWDGWAGVALALQILGDLDRARVAIERADVALVGCTDPTLSSGSAGWALARLALAPYLGDEAGADHARLVLDDLAADPARWGARCQGVGLLTGAAGVAATLAAARRLDDASAGGSARTESWVDGACRYLEAEVAGCRPAPGGALDLVTDDVGLPYLAGGSLGLALALAAVRSALGMPAGVTTSALARAGHIELVVEPGLHRGRLGLAFALDRLARSDQVERPDEARQWRDCHLGLLGRHALRVDDGVGVVGTGSCRLSADLATGAAGALAVLAAVRSPGPTVLDLLLATSAAGPERPRSCSAGMGGASDVSRHSERR